MRLWRRTVNKLKIAIKFLAHTQGSVKIIVAKDINKEKFLVKSLELLKIIERNFEKESKDKINSSLIDLVTLALKVPDISITKGWYYALAIFADHCRDYKNALIAYGKLRSAAEGTDDFKTCWISFFRRANLYIKMQEYLYALRMFKSLLKYSWIDNKPEYEMEAYKGIALWFYYQGIMKKSNFYYRRFMKGKLEPDDSNMKIYSLKRYVNKFKISMLVQAKEKVSYSSTTVYKIRDYTTDYSMAVSFINGVKDSQMSKRSLKVRLETPIGQIRDNDLPDPSIGNNAKGDLFVRMKKAKQTYKNIRKKQMEASGEVEKEEDVSRSSSNYSLEEVIETKKPVKINKLLLKKTLEGDSSENEENRPDSITQRRIPIQKLTNQHPKSIDYLKIQQNDK
jgi:tetratricopeptide (TPR) repeat protein